MNKNFTKKQKRLRRKAYLRNKREKRKEPEKLNMNEEFRKFLKPYAGKAEHLRRTGYATLTTKNTIQNCQQARPIQ